MSNDKFNNDRKLTKAFKTVFPHDSGELKVIESTNTRGQMFTYVQSKENRLKVFDDRIELYKRIEKKEPVKTLELTKETIQALNKLYEEDSIL
jgi:hypothetical protein